jgi:hypothetical protein
MDHDALADSGVPVLMQSGNALKKGFTTDFPFAPADVAAYFTTKLDAYEDLTADEQTAISHGNAWTLFPRLAPHPHTPPSAPSHL